MEITATDVKDLREKTGVGLMDCKNALKESNGDIETAIKYLREKGLSKAAKKSSRASNEGRIFVASSNSGVTILELGCETDFVAKNDDFIQYGEKIAQFITEHSFANVEELKSSTIDNQSFEEVHSAQVLKLGENITVNRFEVLNDPHHSSYVHSNGKIGAILAFNQSIDEQLGKDIAMHIVACSPKYVKPEDVNQEEIESEKEIIATQAKNEGRPENIIERIVEGKIQKFYQEVCLVKQAFVKDDKQTIESILPENTNILSFLRFDLTA